MNYLLETFISTWLIILRPTWRTINSFMIMKQERDAAVVHPVCKPFAQPGWSQPLSHCAAAQPQPAAARAEKRVRIS